MNYFYVIFPIGRTEVHFHIYFYGFYYSFNKPLKIFIQRTKGEILKNKSMFSYSSNVFTDNIYDQCKLILNENECALL